MSKMNNTKVRVNITIDQGIRDLLDERNIIKDKKLSGIVNQLLSEYLKNSSINAINDKQQSFIKKEIKQSIAPLSSQIEKMEERILSLLIFNSISTIASLSDEQIVEVVKEMPVILSTNKYGKLDDTIIEIQKLIDKKSSSADELEHKNSRYLNEYDIKSQSDELEEIDTSLFYE